MQIISKCIQLIITDTFEVLNDLVSLVDSDAKLVVASRLASHNLDRYLYEGSHDKLCEALEPFLFIVRRRELLTDSLLIKGQSDPALISRSFRRLNQLIETRFDHLRSSDDEIDQSIYLFLHNLLSVK